MRSLDHAYHSLFMGNARKLADIINGAGWVLGLVAAGLADYWILPRLAAKLEGRIIPICIGLIIGSILIYSFVVAARWVARRLPEEKDLSTGPKAPRRKTPAEQIPLGSRIMIGVLAVMVAAGMLMGDHGLSLIFR